MHGLIAPFDLSITFFVCDMDSIREQSMSDIPIDHVDSTGPRMILHNDSLFLSHLRPRQ